MVVVRTRAKAIKIPNSIFLIQSGPSYCMS
jgi:hypothetical protein